MATLAREARRRGASQNAAVIHLLRRCLGLTDTPFDNGLARYAGDWSQEEYDAFTSATAPFVCALPNVDVRKGQERTATTGA